MADVVAGSFPDRMYRELDSDEEWAFRKWARENWMPAAQASGLWHPVVREEWAALETAYEELREELR